MKSSAKRIREVDKTSASENETRDGRRENIREEERVKSQRVSFHKAGSILSFIFSVRRKRRTGNHSHPSLWKRDGRLPL